MAFAWLAQRQQIAKEARGDSREVAQQAALGLSNIIK